MFTRRKQLAKYCCASVRTLTDCVVCSSLGILFSYFESLCKDRNPALKFQTEETRLRSLECIFTKAGIPQQSYEPLCNCIYSLLRAAAVARRDRLLTIVERRFNDPSASNKMLVYCKVCFDPVALHEMPAIIHSPILGLIFQLFSRL